MLVGNLITLAWCWDLPPGDAGSDYVFKLYSTGDLGVPMSQWPVASLIPGEARQWTVTADEPQQFFSLTVSNTITGEESGWATTEPCNTP